MSPIGTYFSADEREALGSHRFEPEAIIAFARKFDPQPFHIDAQLARNSIFGGLCASGWHTTAVWMKKNVEHMEELRRRWREAALPALEFGPSPGFRNLRWLRPVFAGETITFFSTIVAAKALPARPGWHLLDHVGEAASEDGKPVLHFESAVMVKVA